VELEVVEAVLEVMEPLVGMEVDLTLIWDWI
jgi:hypothetical protein